LGLLGTVKRANHSAVPRPIVTIYYMGSDLTFDRKGPKIYVTVIWKIIHILAFILLNIYPLVYEETQKMKNH
jgi:hypothetical protein